MKNNDKSYPLAYACYNKDLKIRLQSTSGGVFTLLATYFIENRGAVVFGAAFDENFSVRHICVEDVEKLSLLRGSKYPQSRMGNIYNTVRLYLEEGRSVFFSGTPCQVAGLKSYLGVSYEKLYCLDFVCHGVASSKLWEEYVNELKQRGTICNIIFKSKTKGWKQWYFRVEYPKHVRQVRGYLNKYMRSYLRYCNIRPSCYECKFKGLKREADFTISDCWGIGENNKEINDNKGLSALLIQNDRARHIFNRIKSQMEYVQYPAEKLMEGNWTMYKSVTPDPHRKQFFEYVQKYNGITALNKFFKPSLRKWINYFCLRIIGEEK